MALPASGAISMNQVNVELGLSGTAQISLNDSAVRTLFGVASGAISLNDGHGKANAFAGTISSNQQELNLRTWALANGWGGSSSATITIASGVYIYSDNVTVAALTIDGSWPGGISLINNGFIMGKGGDGGGSIHVASPTGYLSPQAGGPAISLGATVSITSSAGYILGGGGGGSLGSNSIDGVQAGGGGGAGGGEGGWAQLSGVKSGGAGGAPGASGGNGQQVFYKTAWRSSGGGGGRVVTGSNTGGGGETPPGGTGGGAGGSSINASAGGYGAGGSGAGGNAASTSGGGGGGYGASGGSSYFSGAAGGKAVALNGNSVTWVGGFPSSNIFGAVS